MDQAKLEATQRYAMQGGGSGCVIRGGKLVMAWGDQRKRYDLYSSTKSIGVTAIGLAIMDGKVRLDDKAQTYLPQVGVPPDSNRDSGWLGELTLFHLATQTGGFEKTRGWCRQLYRPGTTWAYSDGGPNWLADCLTVAYGRDLLEVMGERVFTPLGITVGETQQGGDHDLYWGFNNLDRPRQLNGINRRPFGAGIHANVAAMAKIGSLYLHRGKWEGTQILPEDFVRLASEPAHGLASLPVKDDLGWTGGASHHYGLLWWNNADGTIPEVPRDAFWTCGMKDSFLVVIPSLDLVVARAGEYLVPADAPARSPSFYNILRPFLAPVCQAVARNAPYPPSTTITGLAWAPVETVICPARKADNWPITWADDGDQYTAYGDGWGFMDDFPRDQKLSLGFCKISGDPPGVSGVNVPSDGEQKGGGAGGKKASGLLMVDGVLYMWIRNAEPGSGEQSQLAWSKDHARSWTWSDWRFAEFGYPCFLNFGKNYEGARDDYVYVYSPDTSSAYYETDDVVLMRVPRTRIAEHAAYEFFQALDKDGRAVWTADIRQRGSVFHFPGGCNRMDVTYNAGLGRYLMVMRSRPKMSSDAHLPDRSSPHGVNQFSVYDASEPWGPWTTVYYTEQWEGTHLQDLQYWQGWGESAHLPSKWMSADGKTIHLLFAGGAGGFSIRQATLTVAEAAQPLNDRRRVKQPPARPLAWGNAIYVNLDVGESYRYLSKSVTLLGVTNNVATVSVDGESRKLYLARLELPTVVDGVRVFLADTRPVATLTTDESFPRIHAALTGDALLCLSDATQPLLDPQRFTFPVSRDDGFRWSMAENSHTFAYLRPARSHEGIDIDLTDARGKEIHALVAIEDATVRWIAQGNSPEACLLLESASYPGLYYIYQHLNRDKLFVQPGQKVRRGEKLAYIWGDGRWGHLHFSVVGSGGQPDYGQRYRYLLNCFPHLVELWHGSLTLEIPVRTSGNFRFANQYWEDGNRQHLSAWSDVLGYGWQLGDWCAAGKVETSLTDEGGKPFQGARLSKIMHQQTEHPARNPQDWFDFEVAVENGTYRVRAEVGDQYAATWQWVEFEGVDAGTFELPPGQLRRTDERPVTVNDGRLTARIQLRDNRTPAGLRNLTFERIP